MATSSQALARAGLIDPTKPGSYPVVLGDDIRHSGDPADRVITGIRYNFKPSHLTDKTTQKTSTLTAGSDGDFDVTFRDNSGGRYIFAGQRVTKGGKYVLVFDSKGRKFILHRLDSMFVMNMTDTPTDHDTEGLKKKHPYIDPLAKRPRPRGIVPPARRLPTKKPGPLRPMTKPTARPKSQVNPFRSPQDIKKKEKRVTLNVPLQESERETKAVKDVREQREAIIVKDARSSSSGGSGGNSPSARDTKEAALNKSRAAALAARPKESSKLSRETKASPDGKSTGYGSGDDYQSRSIDVKTFKSTTTESSSNSNAKSKLSDRPGKATTSKGSSVAAAKKDAGKAGSTPRGKADGASAAKPKAGKAASKAKAAASAPLSLPMPSTPAPKAAPAAKKKKRDDWEEEDEDDEDDGFDLVIEYPKGPSHPVRGAGAGGRHGVDTPQLHMTTFAEFTNGDGDGDDEEDGYWDVTKDEKSTAVAPVQDDVDDADLEAELEEELSKEANAGNAGNAGVDADAALEAELEAEFFAAESESEISEEE